MNYLEVANGNLLYFLTAFVILFVILQSLIFLKKAWLRGKEIGLSTETMREAVKTSAVFAVIPSIPIVIALIAIAPVLGTPFSWMRLSVIGSQSYELIAAGIGASSMGVKNIGDPRYTAQVFSNSMWVMSAGIIWGLVLCIFVLKKYQQGIKKVHQKDSFWAEIMVNSLFFGMLSVFLGRPVTSGGISLYVLLSSAFVMLIFTWAAKITKIRWITDFSLSLSMIAGMGFAVLFSQAGL
ncbi:MAG: DUF5058 family protein [Spirochaetes bacterium]|nr:DUF5058 family protein [Spirochaetota bacterium]